MKKVTYNVYGGEPKEYRITDSEFKKALAEWSQNRPYWCKRLEAMLQKNFSFLETPEEYKWPDKVLIDKNSGTELGVKIVDGKPKYYAKLDFESGVQYDPIEKFHNYEEIKKAIDNGNFVGLDEYLDDSFVKKEARAKLNEQALKQLTAA